MGVTVWEDETYTELIWNVSYTNYILIILDTLIIYWGWVLFDGKVSLISHLFFTMDIFLWALEIFLWTAF